MPLVYRVVGPKKVSNGKLELKGKTDSEFIAVNNETLVNVLRQLASVVTHAGDIFSDVTALTEQVGKRVRSVKLRLDELEAKADLFDPRLVPVPEGTLDDISKTCLPYHHRLHGDCDPDELLRKNTTNLLSKASRPRFLIQLFENAGNHHPVFPPRSPILSSRRSLERQISVDSRRPASFAALRDWKLDDYLDDKIATLDRKKQSAEQLNRALAVPFPSQVVQVDVTGAGFDRMKANRRSLVVHTKKIRRNKRRNTICGSMPNKECGIQTSFTSVASPGGTDEDGSRGSSSCTGGEKRSDENSESTRHHHHHRKNSKKYGIDSGHWSSSCTSSAQDGVGGGGVGTNTCTSTCSAPSPWDPNSLSTSSDFLFDDEDRCLTPQLENFTDGLVSDSDSVDTDGYFTSFRSDCGFPKMKKSASTKELEDLIAKDQDLGSLASESCTTGLKEKNGDIGSLGILNSSSAPSSGNNTVVAVPVTTTKENQRLAAENEYELFGKGSTSTTASSCGTVVMRNKPEPPRRTSSTTSVVTPPGEKGKSQSCDSSCGNEDIGLLEERVKRKSLIERVPSMVVVTPSPSCSSGSPPPLKDPCPILQLTDDGNVSTCAEDSEHDSGRLTPKAEDLFTTNESECGTLSDTDSDRRLEVRLSDIAMKKRSTGSSTDSTGTASTSNSTLTLTSSALNNGPVGAGLPQPDVIPADAVVQQLQIIRTAKATPRLDTNKEYYSLDTVLLGSFDEELHKKNIAEQTSSSSNEAISIPKKSNKQQVSSPVPPPQSPPSAQMNGNAVGVATSGKIRGARVVLDANGEIIFSSETLRRKRKQKVSFDPGSAVKSPDYDSNSTYARVRESVYDRIRKDPGEQEKLYECIEEIRKHNLKPRDPFTEAQQMRQEQNGQVSCSERSGSSASMSSSTPEPHNTSGGLLETDLDSAIPPVMPDLKNLPKIKDRLKRNESYRIANTDDVPPPPSSSGSNTPTPTPGGKPGGTPSPSRSPLSPLHLNRNGLSSLAKRMSLTSPSRHPSLSTSNNRMSSPTPLHLNKKRDIPEEDPNFIQQMFSMNTAVNNELNTNRTNNSSLNNHNGSISRGHLLKSPLDNHNSSSSSPSSKVTLSKFTLSAEDRPSFLRRDSPPTMDDIAKEIYRFRKKFNIQPNASTTTLTRNNSTNSNPVTTTNSPLPVGGGPNYGGSLRRVPLPPPTPNSRPLPRSSSSTGYYTTNSTPPTSTSTLPRPNTIASPINKSTIPAGFPKLSVQPVSPLSSSTPIQRRNSIAAPNPIRYPTESPLGVKAPSPIYYSSHAHNPVPAYGWASSPPPPTSSTPSTSIYSTPINKIPPVPPTRAFGSSKIFPMTMAMRRPSSIAGSLSSSPPSTTSTPTSVQSYPYNHQYHHNSNQYQSATSSVTKDSPPSYLTNGRTNSSQITPSPPRNYSNYNKTVSLLPSLPFRRNSVAFAEPSTSSYSPALKPRTSIGEFKKLLQATQKKRCSISAVEVLKPKGLETTI